MTSQPPAPQFNQPAYYYDEDEISLLDLWLVIMKRKKLAIIVWSVVIAIALLFILVVPKKYNYSTSIEIGTRILNESVQAIEDPTTMLAKVNESYIPQVLQEFQQTSPNSDFCEIKARIPKGSTIIVLESKGTQSDGVICKSLQANVVTKVQADHRRILEILKKEVESMRNISANKLDQLEENAGLLKRQEARMSNLQVLLAKQLIEVNQLLKVATEDRKRAVSEAKNEAKAMTLLLLDADVQKLVERQAALEERINLDLAHKQDELTMSLSNNVRAQSEQQDKVAQLQISLMNLRETRAVVPPMRSLKPTGLGGAVILVLAIVVGIMIALFVVFFAEFLSKAKEKLEDEKSANSKTAEVTV